MIIKNHFHKKGFALGLVLRQRLAASRKWPIFKMAAARFLVVFEEETNKMKENAVALIII